MCILYVRDWWGRTSNNFITIFNAIYFNQLQEKKNGIIKWPSQPNFNCSYLEIDGECKCNTTNYVSGRDMYYFREDNNTMQTRRGIASRYKHAIIHKTILKNLDIISFENVIHIRSGDTMHTKHRMYQHHPIEYYTKFIDNILTNTTEDICIVHEDNKLPSIQKLRNIYSQNNRIIWQSSNLVNDMNTIIRAKTLLTSPGTFSAWIPYLLSDTLQTMCIYDKRFDNPPMVFENENNIKIQKLH